jgi:hypothetical protein
MKINEMKLKTASHLNGLVQCNGVVSREVLNVIPLNDLAVLADEAPVNNQDNILNKTFSFKS